MTETATAEQMEAPSTPWVNPTERVLDPSLIDKSLKERIPSPTGWRIVVLPYKGKAKTSGGVYLPDQVIDSNEVSTTVGYVLKVGDLAYEDKQKFPTGPWCKEGDWIMFARYAGSRFKIEGGEVRILNAVSYTHLTLPTICSV